MQFDKTRIAIRERSWLDILDLALGVLRLYGGQLTLALLAGCVPVALFNAWFLGRGFDSDAPAGFVVRMIWLMLFEIPVATAPATLYLGQALFVERPGFRQVARDFVSCLPQLLVLQVLLRAIVGILFVTLFFPYSMWPYMNEVILLERNPLRARGPAAPSTWRRSSAMHAGGGGDFFARTLGALCVSAMLIVILWTTMWYCIGTFTNHWEIGRWMYTICFPLAAWIVAGYFTVVRFLSYLDLRIRREGWEVELRLRAERARLTRQMA